MQVVRPPTLTASVVDAIRESIFRGDLQPGDPLREIELAESLRVSRGTVREALRDLQSERLVEVIPHRGAFVPQLSLQTARELHTLRALIEPYAVRLALESDTYTGEDLDAIGTLARRLHRLEREHGDTYETIRADVEFHQLICLPSNHKLLLDVLSRLQSLTWLLVFNVHYYRSHEYSDEPSHVEIAEAIRSRNPDLAAETLKHHIDAAGISLLRRMQEVISQQINDE